MKKTMLILFAMLLLVSCAPAEQTETNDVTQDGQNTENTESVVEETEDPGVSALLPQADYNGATFNISLEWEGACRDLPQYEEMNGEVLNDAIVDRNAKVEEFYNVDLVYTQITSTKESREYYPQLAMAGDDTFKLYYSRARYVSEYLGENVARPWNEYSEIIDFEAPWFNTYAIETFSIGDKALILVGDLNDSAIREAGVFLFNKELAEEFNLPNLYDVVDEGNWTIDYLRTVTQDIYVDTNGDGTKDEKDVYGYLTDKWVGCDMWCRTIGLGAVGKDENNMPVFQPLSEASLVGFEKIYSLMWESNGTFVNVLEPFAQTKVTDGSTGMFLTDNAVITNTLIMYLENDYMREMTDFGVLPTPKLTEDQDMGYTHTDCIFSCLLLPSAITEEDAVMSVTLTNALNAFSHEIVIPAYCEKVLKSKLTRDEDSSRMMDLIIEGRRYSLDMIAENDFPLTHITMLRDRLGDKRTGLATAYNANEKRCNTWITEYVEMINNLE